MRNKTLFGYKFLLPHPEVRLEFDKNCIGALLSILQTSKVVSGEPFTIKGNVFYKAFHIVLFNALF